MADITNQSLNEIIENVKTKKVSSTDLTKAYIKNIESAKKLNAFVTTTFDQALDKAKQFDNKPNFDQLLPGIPLACLLYTSPSPRDRQKSRMPSSA